MNEKSTRPRLFDRLENEPAYKVVSWTIEREILNGRLQPGSQLPTETDLAGQFGLTRHTVREGLRILEQSGLVRREDGRRLYVRLPHYAELATRASRALVMHRVTFQELWEMSLDLEPSAARRAADRIKPEQVTQLRDNIAAMEIELVNGNSIIELDIEFHAIVAQAADNRALLLAREPISLLFYPALQRLFTHPRTRHTGPKRLLVAHQNILIALADNDAETAHLWMHKHMVDFKRGYDVCEFDLNGPVDC